MSGVWCSLFKRPSDVSTYLDESINPLMPVLEVSCLARRDSLSMMKHSSDEEADGARASEEGGAQL